MVITGIDRGASAPSSAMRNYQRNESATEGDPGSKDSVEAEQKCCRAATPRLQLEAMD